MSKEQLEEIKEAYEKSHKHVGAYLNSEGIEWLIKQAERVEELEKERDEWKDTAQSYYMTNQELREQNKRYREALESIAYFEDEEEGKVTTRLDFKYIARKALGDEE